MPTLTIQNIQNSVNQNAVIFSAADITTAFNNSELSHLQLVTWDTRYRALPHNIWQNILDICGTSVKQYQTDFYDCDDFAITFAGYVCSNFAVNTAGIVVDATGEHCYNSLVVVNNGVASFAIIEPQSDEWIIKLHGPYQAKSGYVILG